MGSSTPRGRASLAFSRLRVVAFRTVRRRRLPETPDFGAQYPACRYPCPTLQVQHCCCPRMARGQGGSLFLPCTTLSFATLCRFIPALSGPRGPPRGPPHQLSTSASLSMSRLTEESGSGHATRLTLFRARKK